MAHEIRRPMQVLEQAYTWADLHCHRVLESGGCLVTKTDRLGGIRVKFPAGTVRRHSQRGLEIVLPSGYAMLEEEYSHALLLRWPRQDDEAARELQV